MKKIAISIGLLLKCSPLLALHAPISNVGVMSFARNLEDEKPSENGTRIVLECDTSDIDALQNFEAAEVSVVLSDGEKLKSYIYLNNNVVNLKVRDEFLAIGTLDESKNLALKKSLFVEVNIVEGHFALKFRLPAEEKN